MLVIQSEKEHKEKVAEQVRSMESVLNIVRREMKNARRQFDETPNTSNWNNLYEIQIKYQSSWYEFREKQAYFRSL